MGLPLLSQPRKWIGHWWLPDDPDQKVPGVLTYEVATGLTLSLIGGWEYRIVSSIAPGVTAVHEGSRSWATVHGIAENKRITLLDLQMIGAKTFGLGIDTPHQMELIARTALVGCHLGNGEAAEFISASATIENLTAWSRESAIENRMKFDPETDRFENGEIRYRSVVDSPSAEFDGITAKLHHLLTLADFEQSRGSTAIRVVERTSIEFSSISPRPLRELLDLLSGMSDLMSLSTLMACTEITLHLWTPATPDAYPEDHPLRDSLHEVEVEVYERRVVSPNPDGKGADLRKFVLTLDDLPFAELIPKWMKVKDQFASAQSMVLGLSYITEGYLQTRVMTAVGAAESFHRALKVEPPVPEPEFKALRKMLFEAVSPERKQWLAERIARNEPSLRDRLVDLARRPGEFMSALVPNPETWAKEATRARNGLAHDGRSDGHSLEDLHVVVEVTRAVVILNLLFELGVPSERLGTALAEHPTLSHAAKLGREKYPAEMVDA